MMTINQFLKLSGPAERENNSLMHRSPSAVPCLHDVKPLNLI